MVIAYQGQDETKKKFRVFRFETAPYRYFSARLFSYDLDSIGTEFDAKSSSVHKILYQTEEKIKTISVARISDLALSPIAAANYKRQKAQIIANVPIISDEEYSILIDVYACREANKLLRLYKTEEIENVLKEKNRYSDEIVERIRSFLPKTLEELVSEEEEKNIEVEPIVLRCEKLESVTAES